MQQLTGLDAAFLGMETRAVHGHVGSVSVLDPSTAPQPLTLDVLTRFVEARLHLIPAFRRRLVDVPLGIDHPYWIEDPELDIEYHVRELGLPGDGDDRQLSEQVARIHARHLDRTRPLWELYLIHGLAGGRMAVYLKVHHAAIDGVSGSDLIATLLDLTAAGRPAEQVPDWRPDPIPSQVTLAARSAVSLAAQPLRALRLGYGLVKSVPALARPLRPRLPVIDRMLGRDADVVLPGSSGGLRAPATPFNRPIGAHRRWAFRTLPFAEVRAVKAAYGVTVNDVVMTLCAGALRRWLAERAALPDAPLVGAVPVSIRNAADGVGGNRVSMMFATLPTDLPDAAERLKAMHGSMSAAKDVHGALPANLMADVVQFAMPALLGQAARLGARMRLLERVNPFNLIISNVPGPQVTLYFAGARMLAYYPVSAIVDGQGLNITVISYDGGLHFGLLADRDLVPDVDAMAGYLADELDALGPAPAVKSRTRRGTP